jgi:hypothetical protein
MKVVRAKKYENKMAVWRSCSLCLTSCNYQSRAGAEILGNC